MPHANEKEQGCAAARRDGGQDLDGLVKRCITQDHMIEAQMTHIGRMTEMTRAQNAQINAYRYQLGRCIRAMASIINAVGSIMTPVNLCLMQTSIKCGALADALPCAVRQWKETRKECMNEFAHLQGQLDQKTARCAQLEHGVMQLNTDLCNARETHSQELRVLQDHTQNERDERIDFLSREKEAQKLVIHSLRQQMHMSTEKDRSTRDDLTKAIAENNRLNGIVHAQADQLIAKDRELEVKSCAIQEIEKLCHALRHDRDQALATRTEATALIEALRIGIAEVRAENDTLKLSHNELSTIADIFGAPVANLRARVQATIHENGQLNNKLSSAAAQLAQHEENKYKFEAERQALLDCIKSLKETISNEEHARVTVVEMTALLESTKYDALQTEQTAVLLRTQNTELRCQLSSVTDQTDEITTLRNDRESMLQVIGPLSDEVYRLRRDLENSGEQDRAVRAEHERDVLLSHFGSLETQLYNLQRTRRADCDLHSHLLAARANRFAEITVGIYHRLFSAVSSVESRCESLRSRVATINRPMRRRALQNISNALPRDRAADKALRPRRFRQVVQELL